MAGLHAPGQRQGVLGIDLGSHRLTLGMVKHFGATTGHKSRGVRQAIVQRICQRPPAIGRPFAGEREVYPHIGARMGGTPGRRRRSPGTWHHHRRRCHHPRRKQAIQQRRRSMTHAHIVSMHNHDPITGAIPHPL